MTESALQLVGADPLASGVREHGAGGRAPSRVVTQDGKEISGTVRGFEQRAEFGGASGVALFKAGQPGIALGGLEVRQLGEEAGHRPPAAGLAVGMKWKRAGLRYIR
jgi:hypothetical protein